MGKGGCFDIVNMGMQAVRAVVGCFCCMALTGPILIIVGAVMLFGSNSRNANVDTFNNDLANFTAKVAPLIRSTSGSIPTSGRTVSYTTQAVPIQGNMDGVTANPISTLLQSSGTMNPSSSYTVFLTTNAQGWNAQVQSTIPSVGTYPYLKQSMISCTSSNGCTYSDIYRQCQTASGCNTVTISMNPGSLCYNSNCGTCFSYKTLSVVCFQMAFYTQTGGYSVYGSSCDYPFTSQKEVCTTSSGSSSFVYNLRDPTDPYIVLSRLTKGSMDFGLSAAQQRVIGVVLIIIGSLTCAAFLGSCYFVYRLCSNDQHKAHVYSAFGQTYNYPQQQAYQQQQSLNPGFQQQAYPAPGYTQQPQPVYGQQPQPGFQQPQPMYSQQPQPVYAQQPQPGYVQPQPGYVQPQPGYVQPQPGYVQPQPGYVQPQPGYGQPQPVYGQQPQPMYGQQPQQGFQ